MPRLDPPPRATEISEQREVIRRRTFSVRSWEDLVRVGEILKGERFIGSVRVNVGPGGAIQNAVTEERGKLST